MKRNSYRISSGLYYCNEHAIKFKMEDCFYDAGYGCPECAVEYNASVSKNKNECYVYLIEIEHNGDTLYKVGIATNGVSKRYNKKDREKFKNIDEWIYSTKDKAIEEEKRIIGLNSHILYDGDSPFTDGTMTTEIFISRPAL